MFQSSGAEVEKALLIKCRFISYLTVDTEKEEHEKEKDGPKRRYRHLSNALRIDNKCESGT
jgi:hypothetical protein